MSLTRYLEDGLSGRLAGTLSVRRHLTGFANLLEVGAREAFWPAGPAPSDEVAVSAGAVRIGGRPMQDVTPAEIGPRLHAAGVRRVVLVLEGDSYLDLSFTLPEATLADLRGMIENEIAYLSPVPASEALSCWRARYTGHSAAAVWQIDATLTLAERLSPVLRSLHAAGVRVHSVRRQAADRPAWSARPAWAEVPPSRAKGPLRWARDALRLSPVLLLPAAAVTMFLAVAGVSAAQLLLERNALADRATTAQQGLSRLVQEAARHRTLAEAHRRSSERLATVGAIAAALPDDTWLDSLSIEGSKVEMSGFGPSAARTTEDLAQVPGLTSIGFAGPIARNSRQQSERFRIGAYLAVETGGPASP